MKMFSSPLTVQNFALGALTHPISSSAIHIAFEDPFCLPASLYNVMPDLLHWRLVAAPLCSHLCTWQLCRQCRNGKFTRKSDSKVCEG